MNTRIHRTPSLNALRAFEVASRHLSFRRAAEELGVTQSAVAQQVRALEAEIGVKLFERRPRALSLTQNGQRYIGTVRRAFDMLADATQSLAPEKLGVTVSVTPTFATKWLMPRLADYTRAHADVELRVLATERLSHFHTEAVDLAVRYGRPPFGPGIQADLLFPECLVAVGTPRLLQYSGREASMQMPLVLLHDSQSPWSHYFEQFPNHEPAAPAHAIWFNQTTLAIDAALLGQGLALVQKEFVSPCLADGRLAQLFQEEMHTDAGYYVVCPRKPRKPEAVEAVRRWMLQSVLAGT